MARSAPTEPPPDRPPEEERGEKYLTLIEHLQELRYRLTVSAIAVAVGLAVSFYFSGSVIDFLRQPAEAKSDKFKLIFTSPFENFTAYFKVSLVCGLGLAMPVIVYQALRFVSPGLKPGERRWL